MASVKGSKNIPGLDFTSGAQDPVWVAMEPYSKFPKFSKLDKDIECDVVVVGAGIVGISTAYECVKKGLKTVIIEAREVLSGETGRTSGHLSSGLDDRFYELIKTFGEVKAKQAYDSHQYALEHIGDIAKELNIDCEYRTLPAYYIVNVPDHDDKYAKENDQKEEYDAIRKLGYEHAVEYKESGKLGAAYTGSILTLKNQATFHPTKYLNGILDHLTKEHSELFTCYTHTRMRDYTNHTSTSITVRTEGALPPNPKPFSSEHGHSIAAKHLVLSTNAPLHAIALIPRFSYWRTYCIALAFPKGEIEDMSVYDNADPYVYVRQTAHPDPSKSYLLVGGEDHHVGFETSPEQYQQHITNLTLWAKGNFPMVDSTPDYAWSGQILETNDMLAFIGRDNTLGNHAGNTILVATGDSGNGLTHGVIASRLLTDIMTNVQNPWEELYSPSRLPAPRTLLETAKDNVVQISKYSRFVMTDVSDIEDIPACSGAVMHGKLSSLGKPVAVYKDEDGKVVKFSAICPHAHGVVAYNALEGTWDCPVHGSRFDGMTGKCVFGPSQRGLSAQDEEAKMMVEKDTSG